MQLAPSTVWLDVAQHCLYYGILYHPLRRADAGHQNNTSSSVSSDELVRCWVAEDLIFSTTSPSEIPAPIDKKKMSNYYRSAYEAGRVVMQALQEYSLLPSCSVPTTTSSRTPITATSFESTTSQEAVTGVSKLAEDVPQLKQDELYYHVKNDITKMTQEGDSTQLRWVSFMNNDGRHVSWNWWTRMRRIRKPRHNTLMTTLILRGCSDMSVFPFDYLFTPHLRVLDLSYTPINSLPPSFSNLLNLHLLSLRGCSQLKALLTPPSPSSDNHTSPLSHLENLEVLDMNGVPLVELTKQDGSNKSNLHFLDLSGSKFSTMPSEFFCEMSSLEELILGNCSNLKALPPSMAALSNLLVLHVEGTQITSFPEDMFQGMQRLQTLKLINNMLLLSLPMSVSEARGLKELHIYNCISLRLQFLWELVSCLEDLYIQTWKSVEDIKIHGHPNLRTFSLSGPWIRCLSLRGCSKLKIVSFSDDLTALEDVDLSATSLEEVPQNLPDLPQLRKLLLLNVPCFKIFPWHLLVRFPKVFCLDQCADDQLSSNEPYLRAEMDAAENQNTEKTTNIAQISLNDSRIFHSFNADAANKLVNEGQFLQSFKVQVQPCSVRGKKPQRREGDICTEIQRQSPYLDVHYTEAGSIVPMMKLEPKQRHVEMSGNNRYPHGLRHLLSVTKSMFVMDDSFIRCLTDLNYIMTSLEECQLIHCHGMEVVFRVRSEGTGNFTIPEAFPSLKMLQVSNLNNLLSLVEPHDPYYCRLTTLKLLKHIQLEHCPRLEKIFPCSLSLPVLETLIILFCPNLKTIFYTPQQCEVAASPIPCIKRIYLQELPQLLHIHDDIEFEFETPEWEKLYVRGCHSFRRLPLLKEEYPKSEVKVSGEREWWDKLEMRMTEQDHYYLHVPPPEVVSRKKHVIQSYLR